MALPRRLALALATFLSLALLSSAAVAESGFQPLGKSLKVAAPAARTDLLRALDCSGAVALQIGDTAGGSTTGLTSQIDLYGCSSWPETGGEVIFTLSVPDPVMFEIRLSADCDLDLALLGGCDPDLSCLLVADTGVRTTIPTSGDFVVVVDGYEGAACDFTLEVAPVGPSSVDPAACTTAVALNCDASLSLSGDTCDGQDYVRELGCELFPAGGKEHWYRQTLAPGGILSADAVMADGDVVLRILGGCAEAAECLMHADAGATGAPESVSWTNYGPENRTVYLVVDSYGPGSCASYTGTVTCSDTVVPAAGTTWSALKTRFNNGEEK